MYPWKYHELTPRDFSGELLRVYSRSVADLTNPVATSINQAFTVPAEKFLILNGWAIDAVGSAVNFLAGACFVQLGSDTIWRRYVNGTGAAAISGFTAGTRGSVGDNTTVICPPLSVINLTAFFAGAVAGGQSSFYSISGMLIPRGQMSTL